MDLIKYLTATKRQAAFDEAGGWTPIRQTAASDALKEKDPTWGVFIDSVESGGPEPLLVDCVAMQDVIYEAIQGVVLDELTAQEAAAEVQDGLEDLVEDEM